MLDTTRLESGSLDVKRELTDVEEIVGTALQRTGKVLANHSISVDLAPDLPMLPLDGVLLEQTLFNLLDNAAKYAPSGTQIEVRAKVQDDLAIIQVIDEGPGIPLAFHRKILTACSTSSIAFRRATDRGPGPASALRSVAASWRRWAGRIEAGNRSDRPGAVFTITFPIASGAENSAAEGKEHRAWPGGPTAVLIIEDEPAIRRFLRVRFAESGYRVIEAGCGQEAMRRLRLDRPDIIILDLGLPDVDGLDIIREVQQESPVPIVVLSSRADERGKVEALDLGADDYVTKPFGIDELTARLRAALRHRLHQQGEPASFITGDLVVDRVRRLVQVRGTEVKLSPREYDILQLLVQHAGKVLTHQFILREVWKVPTDVQYLRIYIKQLRHKIEPDPQTSV